MPVRFLALMIARPRPVRRPVLAAAAFALAAASCERVSYYSFTGTAPEGTTTSTATTGPDTTAVTRAAVLEAVGACAAILYGEVATAAAKLSDAAATAAASPDPAATQAARDAWSVTIDAWQQAELIRVGPAGPASTPGGKGMRDLVYSWPLVSRCLVEQKLVGKSYEASNFFATALVNMRGLAAAEYLLFYEGTDNACSASASMNSTGTWAALSATELDARKRAYGSAVAADVAAQVKGIADTWSKAGGDFAAVLAGAGASGSIFSSDRLAMNAVSDGLFYIDIDTKDAKLGKPLGLVDCEAATCPEAVESPYARRSRTHVKNNLIGFRRVFSGCDAAGAKGFDDLLEALGKGALAAEMNANIEGAIAAADALPSDDIAAAMEKDKAKVTALHAAIKKITNDLKTEFVSVLDLELPQSVEGDND
jgi:predicted lipoprotein